MVLIYGGFLLEMVLLVLVYVLFLWFWLCLFLRVFVVECCSNLGAPKPARKAVDGFW